jgi:ferritin-like metal-binding protein YciE
MAPKDELIDELRDMYSAEDQLVKALPKLAQAAKNPELKSLFTAHLTKPRDRSLQAGKSTRIGRTRKMRRRRHLK